MSLAVREGGSRLDQARGYLVLTAILAFAAFLATVGSVRLPEVLPVQMPGPAAPFRAEAIPGLAPPAVIRAIGVPAAPIQHAAAPAPPRQMVVAAAPHLGAVSAAAGTPTPTPAPTPATAPTPAPIAATSPAPCSEPGAPARGHDHGPPRGRRCLPAPGIQNTGPEAGHGLTPD